MKMNLQKLHAQKIKWRLIIEYFNQAFLCVNNNEEMNGANAQVMCCIMSYDSPINVFNPKTKSRKGLISYCKINGIATLKNMWM